MTLVLLILLALLVLPSCAALMDTVAGVLADPGVQESLVQTAGSVATGNWTGTIWGLGGVVAAGSTYRKLRGTDEESA